jgi:hypothetical protein
MSVDGGRDHFDEVRTTRLRDASGATHEIDDQHD